MIGLLVDHTASILTNCILFNKASFELLLIYKPQALSYFFKGFLSLSLNFSRRINSPFFMMVTETILSHRLFINDHSIKKNFTKRTSATLDKYRYSKSTIVIIQSHHLLKCYGSMGGFKLLQLNMFFMMTY